MESKTKSPPMDINKMIVRPALGSDYDGVMNISHGIFGGRDILPAMYHYYLYDPTREMFVAEYEGEIIFYICYRITDDGTAYEGEAGRSMLKYRGTGNFGHFQRIVMDSFLRPKYPNVKRITGVTIHLADAKKSRSMKIIPSGTRSVVDFAWKVSLPDVINALQRYEKSLKSQHKLKPAGRDELLPIFTKAGFVRECIPSGIIVRDSQMFDTNFASNLHILLQDRCNDRFVTYDSNNVLQSVSFGTGIEAGVAMDMFRYIIDYYGKSDHELLKAHIMEHIACIPALFSRSKTARNIFINVFTLNITFSKQQLEELSRFTTKELGLYGGDFAVPAEQQVLMINDMSTNVNPMRNSKI